MKKSISILLILSAILFSSCKKEVADIVPTGNKHNFILLDKTVEVSGVKCYQYLNRSTGQIIYKAIKSESSAKAPSYDKRVSYEWVSNVGMTLVCRGFGNTCRTGTICIDGKDVDVIVVKPDVEIK